MLNTTFNTENRNVYLCDTSKVEDIVNFKPDFVLTVIMVMTMSPG